MWDPNHHTFITTFLFFMKTSLEPCTFPLTEGIKFDFIPGGSGWLPSGRRVRRHEQRRDAIDFALQALAVHLHYHY